MEDDIVISTTERFEGTELGMVSGTYVASRVFWKNWIVGIRNFFGWELKEWTEMMNHCRDIAKERMVEKAKSLGANAIYGAHFNTAEIKGSTEILVYGTAVRLGKPLTSDSQLKILQEVKKMVHEKK